MLLCSHTLMDTLTKFKLGVGVGFDESYLEQAGRLSVVACVHSLNRVFFCQSRRLDYDTAVKYIRCIYLTKNTE